MEDKLKLFGKHLSEIRTQKNMTQEKLAELINYSTNHISKLESARTNPSFDLIIKIAEALDIDPKELFNFENKNNNKIISKISISLNSFNEKQLNFIYKTINNLQEL